MNRKTDGFWVYAAWPARTLRFPQAISQACEMARAMAYFSGRPLTVGSRRGRSDSLRGLGEGVGPRLSRLPGDPSGLPEAAGDLQQ